MYHIILLAMKDLKIISKDLKRIVLLTILSIITIIFISNGLSFLFEESIFLNKLDIIIVNEDNHPLSNLLIHQITEDKKIRSIINLNIYADIKDAENSINNNSAVAAIIIPKGFVNSLERGRNYPVELITNKANPVQAKVIETILDSYMKRVSAGQSAVNAVWDYYEKTDMSYEERSRKIDSVINDITFRAYVAGNSIIETEVLKSLSSISSTQFYMFSIIIILMMFLSISGCKEIIIERKLMITKRMKLLGVKEINYLIGKCLYIVIKVLLQSAPLLILSGLIIIGNLQIQLLYLIALLMLTAVAVTAVGLLGAILIDDEEKYISIGNTLIVITALLGGSIIPTIFLPYPITLFPKYTINFWSMEGFIGIMTNHLDEVMTTFLLLLVIIAVAFLSTLLIFVLDERRVKL